MAEHEPTSAAINLGRGARVGKIDIQGNVAGRDMIIGPSPADAEAAQTKEELLALVLKLQERVAALEQAPSGLKDDAADELRNAHDAGQKGDSARLVEKLDTARGYLERIGESLPTALALAQTVGTVAARAAGLF